MAQPYLQNVAIIGAGGQIGSFLVEALLKQGKHRVTAVTRPESTSKMPLGLATVKKAAYDSHEALIEAFRGQDILIVTLNSAQGVPHQQKVVDAAVAAGVRYIIPNEYGNDRTKLNLNKDTIIGQLQLDMRAYIEKVGAGKTHWIAITCGFLYEYSLGGSQNRYGFDIPRRRVMFFDDGTTKITTTTRTQVARAVAHLLALPLVSGDGSASLSDWNDRALYIGDFYLSQRDMLDALLEVTGDKKEDWTITTENSYERHRDAFNRVQNNDLSVFEIMLYTRTFFPKDPGTFENKLQNKLLDLPEQSLKEATKEAVEISQQSR